MRKEPSCLVQLEKLKGKTNCCRSCLIQLHIEKQKGENSAMNGSGKLALQALFFLISWTWVELGGNIL